MPASPSCTSSPTRYRAATALILLAGYGGLRWAELVGLRRHHVDPAGARVQVVEQAAEVAGKIIVNPPKRMRAGGW
ncbi:MAG TPA: hypothetical protein VLA80_00420 [Actinomycetota bacterium]|nr:hypothetical protein [Actinomycetota bacterium]